MNCGVLLLISFMITGFLPADTCQDCCNADAMFQLRQDKCLLTKSTQKLTARLMKEIGKLDDNVFISPFSVSNILRLLLLASRGDTTTELRAALSPHSHLDIHNASRCLSDKVYDSTGETLNMTNDFFISSEYKASATGNTKNIEYKNKAMLYYRADFYNCNFEKRPENARRRINMIVGTKTRGLIPQLFDEGDISSETKLVIVNTITFKSNWLNRFNKTLTHTALFSVSDTDIRETTFMKAYGSFRRNWWTVPKSWDETDMHLTAVDMPYESTEYSMLAIKYDYDRFRDLADIESYVAEQGILNVREILTDEQVELTFPKFKRAYDRDLNEIFNPETGLRIVFSPRADYGDFADGLFISNIIHKAAIEVNEDGTVASAHSSTTFFQRGSEHVITFDSPFVFYVYHSCDGLVLFQGRYSYPIDPTHSNPANSTASGSRSV